MRKLNTSDVLKFARIMKYSGIKSKILDLFDEAQGLDITDIENPKVKEFGFKAVMEVIEAIASEKVEGELYEFLAGVTEKTKEEIEEQEFTATIDDIKAIARENNLLDFFKSSSKLIQ